MFRVADIDVSECVATLPDKGVWHVRATLSKASAPEAGAAVSVSLGDLTLSGTVRTSAVYEESARVLVVGGRDGWRRILKQKHYTDRGGVAVAEVAQDIASEAGETLEILQGADGILGAFWTRVAGPAADELTALGRPWWVGVDGTTRLGARPEMAASGLKVSVVRYDPVGGTATLVEAENAMSKFVPGTRIEVETMPSVLIRWCIVRVTGMAASVDVGVT